MLGIRFPGPLVAGGPRNQHASPQEVRGRFLAPGPLPPRAPHPPGGAVSKLPSSLAQAQG